MEIRGLIISTDIAIRYRTYYNIIRDVVFFHIRRETLDAMSIKFVGHNSWCVIEKFR